MGLFGFGKMILLNVILILDKVMGGVVEIVGMDIIKMK